MSATNLDDDVTILTLVEENERCGNGGGNACGKRDNEDCTKECEGGERRSTRQLVLLLQQCML